MMKQRLHILFVFLFFSITAMAQDGKQTVISKTQEHIIDGLTIYPNPTSSGKVYIATKSALEKRIEIFDVLGKKVIDVTTTKEINISNLTAGVYIIKVKEGEATATRKLIVN